MTLEAPSASASRAADPATPSGETTRAADPATPSGETTLVPRELRLVLALLLLSSLLALTGLLGLTGPLITQVELLRLASLPI